jgi:hypothetical protein
MSSALPGKTIRPTSGSRYTERYSKKGHLSAEISTSPPIYWKVAAQSWFNIAVWTDTFGTTGARRRVAEISGTVVLRMEKKA